MPVTAVKILKFRRKLRTEGQTNPRVFTVRHQLPSHQKILK